MEEEERIFGVPIGPVSSVLKTKWGLVGPGSARGATCKIGKD